MTLPGSKEKILKYIEEHDGKKMKQDVVDYMSSESSRVPTLKIIKELQSENRIKVSGTRQGQSHYLSINRDNDFDWIDQHLSKIAKDIEKMGQEYEMKVKLKNGKTTTMPASSLTIATLCMLAAHVSRDIKNKNDMQLLNDKILQLMINMGIKNIRQQVESQ